MRMKNKRTLLWTNCWQKGSCLFYRDTGIKYYSCEDISSLSFSSASARLESRISTSTSPPFKALNTAFALDTPDTREILRSIFLNCSMLIDIMRSLSVVLHYCPSWSKNRRAISPETFSCFSISRSSVDIKSGDARTDSSVG